LPYYAGSKVIIQEENRVVATPDELIIIPAIPLEIINQPVHGQFRSDLLLLSPDLLAEFKRNMYAIFQPPGLRPSAPL
jgi:hypothetical protein